MLRGVLPASTLFLCLNTVADQLFVASAATSSSDSEAEEESSDPKYLSFKLPVKRSALHTRLQRINELQA